MQVIGIGPRDLVTHRATRPTLVVTLEASAVDVTVDGQRLVVDRTSIACVPARATLRIRSALPASRIVLLGIEPVVVDAVERRYRKLGLDRARLEGELARIQVLPRTVWIHEIVHRYVFERHVLEERHNLATKFLEVEIVKEVYYLFRDRTRGADRAAIGHTRSPVVEKALAWIESHLFSPCPIAELARRAGASESTLLRAFVRELGCRPGEYWRERRLDEALALIRSGRSTVAEVATRTGYENPTSFGHAFRQRFGRPPSAFLPTRPTRRAP